MKIKILENEIERGGKIKNFTLRPGEKITFLEGATFKGNPVKAGTILYNNEELPKNLDLSPEGGLMLVPFKRPGTPHPGIYN